MDHPLLRPGMHRCPAHEDRSPSLSVSRGTDGRWLFKCHAGCPTEAVMDASGLSWHDLFETALPPRDRQGYRPTWKELAFLKVAQHEARAKKKRDAWRLWAWCADEEWDGWQLVDELRRQATALGDCEDAWTLLEHAADLERDLWNAEAARDA